MKKKVLIMGSSGSIGTNTLEVIRNHPDMFEVSGLAVNSSTELLLEQIQEFKPAVAAIRDSKAAGNVYDRIPKNVSILEGDKGLEEIACQCDYDIFVGAMVGFAGLAPTVKAIKRGKRIALANKETLVVAGELVKTMCREYNAELLPIDSEHSAIFQCLAGEQKDEIKRLILTASGGPFYKLPKSEFEKISVQQALKHPTWQMGSKITIDSATLMNKGLEVIEAHWLFDFPIERIDVVIHPQSIIHSMIEFIDGSIKAQLSAPDMKLPIQYALAYPKRLKSEYVTTNLPAVSPLTFAVPDTEKFECLKLAYQALEQGGTAPCILNASNEIAVTRFLRGDLGFVKIPYIINQAFNRIANQAHPGLEQLIECDLQTRMIAEKL